MDKLLFAVVAALIAMAIIVGVAFLNVVYQGDTFAHDAFKFGSVVAAVVFIIHGLTKKRY